MGSRFSDSGGPGGGGRIKEWGTKEHPSLPRFNHSSSKTLSREGEKKRQISQANLGRGKRWRYGERPENKYVKDLSTKRNLVGVINTNLNSPRSSHNPYKKQGKGKKGD